MQSEDVPLGQEEFVYFVYEAIIRGCRGIELPLPGVENAVLEFLIVQKLINPRMRWQADDISKALDYGNPKTVFNAKSQLYNGDGDGLIQQACGDCIAITNSQKRLYDGQTYSKGYALINHIPIRFIRRTTSVVLLPDPVIRN